jgi:hypothetical protein
MCCGLLRLAALVPVGPYSFSLLDSLVPGRLLGRGGVMPLLRSFLLGGHNIVR